MSKIQSFNIKLPKNYRGADFLAFHQRDQLMIAERVSKNVLTKGIMWQGDALQLEIEFKKNYADIRLKIDSKKIYDQIQFQAMIERMLGLQQNITEFEQTFNNHPHLSSLISKNSGLRVAVTATPFEALSWAITGQQISIGAAISIRRKFIQAAGVQHSSGLWCYPDENIVSNLSVENLRQAGFSKTKANTLITLSHHLTNNHINLNNVQMSKNSIDDLSKELMQIRGIGPWTVNYALLRGFGWLDGSLHGDVAVRSGLQKLLGVTEKISEKEAQQWLLEFSPWRALVAAHLWEM